MAAQVDQIITASSFNAIRSKANRILGSGDSGTRGYGIPLESSTKVDNDIIQASDMQALYNDLVKARQHQVGIPVTWSNATDGLSSPSTGELVGVFAADVGPGGNSTSATATSDLDEGFLDFENAANDIESGKFLVGAGQSEISTLATNARVTNWNGSLTFGFTLTWENFEERRFWFNSGGYITIASNLAGGTSIPGNEVNTPPATKDEIWQTMLNNMGTYKISVSGSEVVAGTATINSGVSGIYSDTSNATDWSAYNNSNRLTVMSKSGTGIYSENEFKIEAWQTNTNSIRFLLTYSDNDIGDDVDGDEYSNPVDENVTGTITAVVTARTATGLGKEYPALTINDEF